MPPADLQAAVREARAALLAQDHAGARFLLRGILERVPHQPAATALMAQVETEEGRPEDAHARLAAAIGHHGRAPRLRVQLARLETAQGRFERALEQLDRAKAEAPGIDLVDVARAECLERLGDADRLDALIGTLRPDGAVPPGLAAVAVRRLAARGEIDRALVFGRAVAAGMAPEGLAARDLLFSLARVLERSGAYDEAFETAARANAIARPPFDPSAWDRMVDAIIEAFPAGRFDRSMPAADDETVRAVFVVGLPRCGSTLVERILDAHPAVHGAGEVPDFHRIVQSIDAPSPGAIGPLEPAEVDRLRRAYLDALHAFDAEAQRVVNKDLGAHLHLGLARILLPSASFIDVRRGALDHCLACWFERLRPSAAPWAADLRHLGRVYRAHERIMAHWHAVLPRPPLRVDYESLVEDVERGARRIIEHVGLPWDEACLAFHRTARVDRTLSYDQARRPVYSTSVGRAEAYGARLDPLRAALGLD